MSEVGRSPEQLADALEGLDPPHHLCIAYSDPSEQLAVVVPFFRAALDRHQRCVYIAEADLAASLVSSMSSAGIDVAGAQRAGAFSLAGTRDTYLQAGRFDPDLMLEWIRQLARDAAKAGFSGLWPVGEMSWLLEMHPGVERAAEYEAKLDRFVTD